MRRTAARRLGLAFSATMCALALSVEAGAELARIELHQVPSRTLTDAQFLRGAAGEGKAVVLGGKLRLPQAQGPVPAVVLLHGSGGIRPNVDLWARELVELGVAAFIVDSFTGRGIAHTVFDQGQLGRLAMIVDAYRALEVLAADPRIDPGRIALMGFSRGGQAALYASLARFQALHGPKDAAFAAYLPFYPPCNTTFADDLEVAAAPIRVFHGTADDYNPAAPCRAYVGRLRGAGADARMIEYAGAHHAFDDPSLATPLALAEAPTSRNCRLAEQGGQVVDASSGRRFTWQDPCVERGPTVAYDIAAHRAAVADVREFLRAALGLE